MFDKEFVSTKEIISRVYRNLNIEEDLRFEDMQNWIHECIELINNFKIYEHKLVEITVTDYKAKLPCDLHQFIMVSLNGFGLRYKPNQYYYAYTTVSDSSKYPTQTEKTYDVVYPYIHTSFKEGTLLLEYLALPMDKDNYLKIPDIEPLKQALFWYILKMLIMGGYKPNTQSLTFDYCEQQVKHYIGAAHGQMNMPTIAQAENIYRERMKLIPQTSHYRSAFRHLGNKEYIEIEGKAKTYYLDRGQFTNNRYGIN